MSAEDTRMTLQTRHSDKFANSPILVSLYRYVGPTNVPAALSPQQTRDLATYVEGNESFVMDLSMLPLKEHTRLPWGFDNDSYFGAVVTAMLNPMFIQVTFLKLCHLALTRIDALSPLANILEGLDLSYNQLATVQKDCAILSSFSRLQEVNLVGNPCEDDEDYRNKLNSMNRMITTIDGVSISRLATFFSLAPGTVIETRVVITEEDPIATFLVQFLTYFDSDRQHGGEGILTSAYAHDAVFSLHYMARGVVNPDFAPISIRRNVGMLLGRLPPSLHNFESIIVDDVIPIFGKVLRMVQFRVECLWSATHPSKYRRTILLQQHAQKPWDLTILNDQIQMECDANEYAVIFEDFLSTTATGGPINSAFAGQHAAGSIRASAANVTRQWNKPQTAQRGGFQRQQQRGSQSFQQPSQQQQPYGQQRQQRQQGQQQQQQHGQQQQGGRQLRNMPTQPIQAPQGGNRRRNQPPQASPGNPPPQRSGQHTQAQPSRGGGHQYGGNVRGRGR